MSGCFSHRLRLRDSTGIERRQAEARNSPGSDVAQRRHLRRTFRLASIVNRNCRPAVQLQKNRFTGDFMKGRKAETAKRIAHTSLVILAACFALAGCGGGGSDNTQVGGISAPSG